MVLPCCLESDSPCRPAPDCSMRTVEPMHSGQETNIPRPRQNLLNDPSCVAWEPLSASRSFPSPFDNSARIVLLNLAAERGSAPLGHEPKQTPSRSCFCCEP